MVFFMYMPRIGVAGSYGSSTFRFLKTLLTVLQVAVSIYLPNSSVGGLLSLHTLSIMYCLLKKCWIMAILTSVR